MAKMFDRATIESNDDGSFSVAVTPVPKDEKGKDGMVSPSYGKDKRATCQSLAEVGGKIESMCAGENTKDESDEKSSDGEKLKEYFNGAKYTAEKAEDSEKD